MNSILQKKTKYDLGDTYMIYEDDDQSDDLDQQKAQKRTQSSKQYSNFNRLGTAAQQKKQPQQQVKSYMGVKSLFRPQSPKYNNNFMKQNQSALFNQSKTISNNSYLITMNQSQIVRPNIKVRSNTLKIFNYVTQNLDYRKTKSFSPSQIIQIQNYLNSHSSLSLKENSKFLKLQQKDKSLIMNSGGSGMKSIIPLNRPNEQAIQRPKTSVTRTISEQSNPGYISSRQTINTQVSNYDDQDEQNSSTFKAASTSQYLNSQKSIRERSKIIMNIIQDFITIYQSSVPLYHIEQQNSSVTTFFNPQNEHIVSRVQFNLREHFQENFQIFNYLRSLSSLSPILNINEEIYTIDQNIGCCTLTEYLLMRRKVDQFSTVSDIFYILELFLKVVVRMFACGFYQESIQFDNYSLFKIEENLFEMKFCNIQGIRRMDFMDLDEDERLQFEKFQVDKIVKATKQLMPPKEILNDLPDNTKKEYFLFSKIINKFQNFDSLEKCVSEVRKIKSSINFQEKFTNCIFDQSNLVEKILEKYLQTTPLIDELQIEAQQLKSCDFESVKLIDTIILCRSILTGPNSDQAKFWEEFQIYLTSNSFHIHSNSTSHIKGSSFTLLNTTSTSSSSTSSSTNIKSQKQFFRKHHIPPKSAQGSPQCNYNFNVIKKNQNNNFERGSEYKLKQPFPQQNLDYYPPQNSNYDEKKAQAQRIYDKISAPPSANVTLSKSSSTSNNTQQSIHKLQLLNENTNQETPPSKVQLFQQNNLLRKQNEQLEFQDF